MKINVDITEGDLVSIIKNRQDQINSINWESYDKVSLEALETRVSELNYLIAVLTTHKNKLKEEA